MHRICIDAHDRETWNSFVASSPHGHILQAWEWGELKSRTGWRATRLTVQDGPTILAAAQVLVRSLPYGFGSMAYVPRGPVLDYGDEALLRATIEALKEVTAKERAISLKIEPEVLDGSPVTSALLRLGLKEAPTVQMRSSIWVDLSPPEEEILARQKQKTRYNTRLAARKGVTVRSGTLQDLDGWYRLFVATAQRDRFSIHDLNYYRLVLETLGPHDMASLLLAHHEGDLLGGIIVFTFGDKAQYMYGASSNEKRNLMAPYLLQWEGMRWARDQGATIYDLWGIPDRLEESDDLWGVYRHKRGYGGEIVRYIGAFDMVRSPLQHVALERVARPLFKRVARLSVQRA